MRSLGDTCILVHVLTCYCIKHLTLRDPWHSNWAAKRQQSDGEGNCGKEHNCDGQVNLDTTSLCCNWIMGITLAVTLETVRQTPVGLGAAV